MSEAGLAVVMEEVTDPQELAMVRARREQFDRNFAWLQAHAAEIYSQHRGECVCIAGEEFFAAATPREALALGQAAHLEDQGSFVLYIPRERLVRVYGNLRRLASG